MKYLKFLFAITLFLLCEDAIGQSFNWGTWPLPTDTVQSRYLISALPDSTLFEYEIAQLRIRNGTFDHFIRFDSTTDTFPGYYQTEPFTANSNHDSLSFLCFASFDNKSRLQMDSMNNLDSVQVDSVIKSWAMLMSGSFITPDPRYFDDTSFVFYTLELYNADNDSLIKAIDTIRCFVDPTGSLFYSASKDRTDFIRLPIPVDSGTRMYVKVNRTVILPTGSYFTNKSLVYNRQRGLREDTFYEGYQRKYPMASPPIVISSVPWHGSGEGISALSPNPAALNVSLVIDLSLPLASKITVTDNLGRTLFKDYVKLHAGSNRVTLDISTLPVGDYVVNVPMRNEIFHGKLVKN